MQPVVNFSRISGPEAMIPHGQWFDLDLARMRDEELVVLAQECGYRPARDELLQRFYHLTQRLVWREAARKRIQGVDRDDAGQEVVFWVIEAINCYDTLQLGRRNGCSFRSFLFRVATVRFLDFVKRLRRLETHFQPTSQVSVGTAPFLLSDGDRSGDPATLAEEQEFSLRIGQALQGLDSGTRDLWAMLASGTRLREIAAIRGISYYAAKRQRRALLAKLTIRLRVHTR